MIHSISLENTNKNFTVTTKAHEEESNYGDYCNSDTLKVHQFNGTGGRKRALQYAMRVIQKEIEDIG
jgi:hypothetical protein